MLWNNMQREKLSAMVKIKVTSILAARFHEEASYMLLELLWVQNFCKISQVDSGVDQRASFMYAVSTLMFEMVESTVYLNMQEKISCPARDVVVINFPEGRFCPPHTNHFCTV